LPSSDLIGGKVRPLNFDSMSVSSSATGPVPRSLFVATATLRPVSAVGGLSIAMLDAGAFGWFWLILNSPHRTHPIPWPRTSPHRVHLGRAADAALSAARSAPRPSRSPMLCVITSPSPSYLVT
jgi:hypothetical protein